MPPVISDEELKESALTRALESVDPRTHVATRTFFQHLRPDTADQIATWHLDHARSVLEAAWLLRDVFEIYVDNSGGEENFRNSREYTEFQDGALCNLLRNVPERGREEIEPVLGAIRAFEDDGLYVELGNIVQEAAARIVTEDIIAEEMEVVWNAKVRRGEIEGDEIHA